MKTMFGAFAFASIAYAINSDVHVPESQEEQAARLEAYHDLVYKLKYNPTPAPNNPDLDCRLRRVAYDFTLKIMPSRAPLQTMWDAMVSIVVTDRQGHKCNYMAAHHF